MLLLLPKDHRNLPLLLSSKHNMYLLEDPVLYCAKNEAALVLPRRVGFFRVTGVDIVAQTC